MLMYNHILFMLDDLRNFLQMRFLTSHSSYSLVARAVWSHNGGISLLHTLCMHFSIAWLVNCYVCDPVCSLGGRMLLLQLCVWLCVENNSW